MNIILDILRLKPIKELISENEIDYNQLRIIIAIFEYEYGINGQTNKNDIVIENVEPSYFLTLKN